mmetsp:Transcript_19775/g.61967  ORF Transcript_19775/g.61967 Transcript_19775/m.61967 type:complete len:241 (+) Transcript_19775:1098-1820(+)
MRFELVRELVLRRLGERHGLGLLRRRFGERRVGGERAAVLEAPQQRVAVSGPSLQVAPHALQRAFGVVESQRQRARRGAAAVAVVARRFYEAVERALEVRVEEPHLRPAQTRRDVPRKLLRRRRDVRRKDRASRRRRFADPPGSRTRARNSADGAGCFGDAAATGRAGAGAVASRASTTSAGAAGTYLGGRNPFKITCLQRRTAERRRPLEGQRKVRTNELERSRSAGGYAERAGFDALP